MMETLEDVDVDLRSTMGIILSKVKKLELKPLLDEAFKEVLNEFLVELKRAGSSLTPNPDEMNFTAASLILESSTSIFGKHVDLLKEEIHKLEKRLQSYDCINNHTETEEKVKKARCKKAPKEILVQSDENSKKKKKHSFMINLHEIQDFKIDSFTTDNTLFSEWSNKLDVFNHITEKKRINKMDVNHSFFHSSNNAIYDENQDGMFITYTSKMNSSFKLDKIFSKPESLDDFQFELYSQLCLVPEFVSKKFDISTLNCSEFISAFRMAHQSSENPFGSISNKDFCEFVTVFNSIRKTSFDLTDIQECYQKAVKWAVTTSSTLPMSKSNIEKIFIKDLVVNIPRASEEKETADDMSSISEKDNVEKDTSDDVSLILEKDDVVHREKRIRERMQRDSNKIFEKVIPCKKKRVTKAPETFSMDADFAEFERFYQLHYQLDEHEDYVSDRILNENSLKSIEKSSASSKTVVPVASVNQKTVSSNENTSTSNDDISIKLRVGEWKEHMSEKLKDNDGSNFDIHEYTKNLKSQLKLNCPEKFSRLCSGKTSAEVCRFFMSALHLADSSTVELGGIQEGKLSNDTFFLNLVNEHCPHEQMDQNLTHSPKRPAVNLAGNSSKKYKGL